MICHRSDPEWRSMVQRSLFVHLEDVSLLHVSITVRYEIFNSVTVSNFSSIEEWTALVAHRLPHQIASNIARETERTKMLRQFSFSFDNSQAAARVADNTQIRELEILENTLVKQAKLTLPAVPSAYPRERNSVYS